MTTARDWGSEESFDYLMETIARKAPRNIAPIPFSMSQEFDPVTGCETWRINIHVRIRGYTEYEVEGEGATKALATKAAFVRFSNQPDLIRFAARDAAQFGITH